LNNSIKSKFLFFSLTIFVVMFAAVGSHNYYKTQDEIMTRMNEQITMAKLRASTVLPSLIWNFASDSIRDFSKAELRSEFINGIIVSDGSETLFSGIKNEDNAVVFDQANEFEEQQGLMLFDLVHVENEERTIVGHVTIRENKRYIDERLNQVLWQQILQSVAYCIVLFALIWALISRLVLLPIVALNKRLNSITREISQR